MAKWHSEGRFRSKQTSFVFPQKNATAAAILANQQHHRIFFLRNGEPENIFKWKGRVGETWGGRFWTMISPLQSFSTDVQFPDLSPRKDEWILHCGKEEEGSDFHRRSGVVVVCWHLQNPFKRGRVTLHLTPVWKKWLIFFLSLFLPAGSGAYLVFPLKYAPLRPFFKKRRKIHLFSWHFFPTTKCKRLFSLPPPSPSPSLSRKKVESEKKVFFLLRLCGVRARNASLRYIVKAIAFWMPRWVSLTSGVDRRRRRKSREKEVLEKGYVC